MNLRLNFIDLFAGAGGLSEGFIRAGYNPIAHIEMEKYACNTLKTRAAFHWLKGQNRLYIYEEYLHEKKEREDGSRLWLQVPKEITDTVIQSEIDEKTIHHIFDRIEGLVGKRKDDIDIIIGGPPCQAYSVAGRARDPKGMENDPRNFLYGYYVCFLKQYKPKIFVFENVPGIMSARNGAYFDDFKKKVDESGYTFEYRILNAADYGVLQKRKRIVIIGWKKKLDLKYPNLNKENNPYEILSDLFPDLPIRKHGEGSLTETVKYSAPATKYLEHSRIRNGFDFTIQHVARHHNSTDLEIYRLAIDLWLNKRERLDYANLPPELQKHNNVKSFLNRFQVVDPYGCSHTIVAHIAMDGHYYIYPSLEQIRSITVREAARIQSFPDDYYFEGSRSAAFKQIGNAVPVVLAYKIAKELKKQFAYGL